MGKTFSGFALAGLLAFSTASFASAYSVNDAFYDNEVPNGSEANPFGAYTFGYSFNPSVVGSLSTSSLIHTDTFNGNANIEGYYINNNVIVPALLINTSAAAVTTNFSVTLASHQLLLHAGNTAANGAVAPFASAVLRYTVPSAGTYDISAIFSSLDRGITDVSVLVNGTAIYSATDAGSYSGLKSLAVGDAVDFVVGPGNDSSIYYDSTGLFANIAQVPEPGSIALFGLALSALGIATRRKA